MERKEFVLYEIPKFILYSSTFASNRMGDILETICQKKEEMMKCQGTRIYCSVDSLRECQMGE